jgi:predicted glycoside hydrolase/deacetylase ChbG (UPF0249 family)
MKHIIIANLFLVLNFVGFSQPKTVQERLGYPKETKLLIIHADDIGVSHSENVATMAALEKGIVNSGSIMVPCPWFPEIAAYASAHPNADLGLHLTLTSEWQYYKWGPVTLSNEVAGLVDDKGFFYDNVASVIKNAKVEEVEKELRSQIELAIKAGVNPTHFDAHMATVLSTAAYLQVFIKLGREYKVPVLLNRQVEKAWFNIDLDSYINEKDIVVDNVFMAMPDDFKNGMDNYYSGALKTIKPGLNCILLHAAYDNDEMQAVTVNHPDYGAAWRQADYNFFTSDKCKKLLTDEKIKLITWKEVRDKLVRSK